MSFLDITGVDAVIDESERCSNAVDIAFLVDSSHTVRNDWSKELLFVQRIANRYDLLKFTFDLLFGNSKRISFIYVLKIQNYFFLY